MQNKPNFRYARMAVSLIKTMTNNNEQRTMNYSKQTQSNPICSELVEPISKGAKIESTLDNFEPVGVESFQSC